MQNGGIRIQKVLSDNGLLSRRKAEEYIKKGKIQVNGRKAIIGQKMNPSKDTIHIDNELITLQKRKNNIYVLLHKPRGFVTTLSDELGRRCITDLIKQVPEKVYPVGRLDRESEGLLILTNDGEFANYIMHPRHHIPKTYRVTVRPGITDETAALLSAGVMIDNAITMPSQVLILSKEPGRVVLQITIYEGRNRQIRKMCESVGLEVARLKRVSVGPVKLGMLQPGEWRMLTPTEVGAVRNAVKEENIPNPNSKRKKYAPRTGATGKPIGKKVGKPDAKSIKYKKK
ncbi:MAG: pseudouridine synthase [Oscillospiraceae bacterium]